MCKTIASSILPAWEVFTSRVEAEGPRLWVRTVADVCCNNYSTSANVGHAIVPVRAMPIDCSGSADNINEEPTTVDANCPCRSRSSPSIVQYHHIAAGDVPHRAGQAFSWKWRSDRLGRPIISHEKTASKKRSSLRPTSQPSNAPLAHFSAAFKPVCVWLGVRKPFLLASGYPCPCPPWREWRAGSAVADQYGKRWRFES